MKPSILALSALLTAAPAAAHAEGLHVAVLSNAARAHAPKMGDHLTFHSIITNSDASEQRGVIAWLALLRTDPGHEQPVDLEDWSAQKAISSVTLAPGAKLESEWPMRLIEAGHYRLVISASSIGDTTPTPSRFVDFEVRPKAVVESRRILPVAIGIPLLLAGFLVVGSWRRLGKWH